MERLGESGEVDDYAVAYVSSAHGAAGTPGSKHNPVFGCPPDEALQVVGIDRPRNGLGKDTIDAGALGVRGAGPGVSPEYAPKRRRRQHRPKLIMFSLYG